MQTIVPIADDRVLDILREIVEEFGDGRLSADKNVFDQITRTTADVSEKRLTVDEVVSRISNRDVLVVLDPHPSNRAFANSVAQHFGDQDALGFQAPGSRVADFLRFYDCDMYITTLDGKLLAVGCHEDLLKDGQRVLWSVIRD